MHTHSMDIKQQAIAEITQAQDAEHLENLRVKYLGRKGIVTGLFSDLVKLKGEQRKTRGQELNVLKIEVETALWKMKQQLETARFGKLTEQEKLDVTFPGTRPPQGHLHITTQAIEEISRIFAQIGFQRVRYPEVDWDHYAFEALNMPKGHPARDEWETFFVASQQHGEPRMLTDGHGEYLEHPKLGKMVLTPHTSNGQLREMERRKPPIRMINIAKCYRRQADTSHTPMFHQFEGLLIDKGVSVTHLKGTLEYFVKAFFGAERKIRLRPFHFRFTEPSFEIDISCGACGGTGLVRNPSQPPLNLRGGDIANPPLKIRGGEGGVMNNGTRCRLCKSGWHELGGSGMVHPNVLRQGGLDPKKWSGFAFGWGVERNYMMKAGLKIPDLRLLYNNDLNFLEQF